MLKSLLLILAIQGPADLEVVRGWIETGGAVAERLAALDQESGRQAALALETAARVPSDWREVLLLDGFGRALARRFAHDGLPAGVGYADLSTLLQDRAEAAVQALVAAAALAPARVTGRQMPTALERQQAVATVAGFLAGEDVEDTGLLIDRVRAHLDASALRRIAASLNRDAPVNRRQILTLLTSAPFSQVRPVLRELALDQGLRVGERVRVAENLVLGGGRAELELLISELGPETDLFFFRRVMDLWRSHVEPADLQILEELCDVAPANSRHQPLQLWARHETGLDRRLEIYRRILAQHWSFQAPTLEALATAGRHEGIAESLLASLESSSRGMHALSLAMLPAFAEPERLLEEYSIRLKEEGSFRHRGRWAGVLAYLALPAARRAAAEWLVAEGAGSERDARRVAVALAAAPEVDPYLGRMFRMSELPEPLLNRLALARSAHSDEAREYLRRRLEAESGVILAQSVQNLAAAGVPEDTLLLWALARDSEFDSTARAAAIDGLSRRTGTAVGLLEYLQDEPEDYEVADALIRGGIIHGDAGLRRLALAKAAEGMGRSTGHERRGLRGAALRAQALRPLPEEAADLAQRFLALMQEASPEGADQADLRRLAGEYPELTLCAKALGAVVTDEETPELLLAWRPAGVPHGLLLYAAMLLADELPSLATSWARSVAENQGASESERVRAASVWARTARRLPGAGRRSALENLVGHPTAVRAHPWDLEMGLGDEMMRGWVLPGDRLVDLLLLEQDSDGRETASLLKLGVLLDGYADPATLGKASVSASSLDDGGELALRLARRAVDWDPAGASSRLALANALAAAEDPAAHEVYEGILRMPLAGPLERRLAQEGLKTLADASDRTVEDR